MMAAVARLALAEIFAQTVRGFGLVVSEFFL